MDFYYLDDQGRPTGPVTESVLRVLHQGGVVKDATLVAQSGSEEWTTFEAAFRKAGPVDPAPSQAPVPPALVATQGPAAAGSSVKSSSSGLVIGLLVTVVVLLGAGTFLFLERGKDKNPAAPGMADAKPALSAAPVTPAAAMSAPPQPAQEVVMPPQPGPGSGAVAGVPAQPASAPRTSVTVAAQSSSDSGPDAASLMTDRTTIPALASPSAPPSAPLFPSSPPAKQPEGNPLAEWYDFGYRQGKETSRVFADFGTRATSEKSQLMQLLKNLDVDSRDVSAEGLALCYQGYKDGVEGRIASHTVPADQSSSVLPRKLRGYHRFASLAGAGSGDEIQDMIDHATACTVMIRVSGPEGGGHGSGFFVAPGIIVTNRHVVEGGVVFDVRLKDRTIYPGKLIAKSEDQDIAMLSVEYKDNPILRLGNSRKVRQGSDIRVVGFPQASNLDVTVTKGTVSGLGRVLDNQPCFQVDAATNPGNSGGPHVNDAGEVIAIHTFGIKQYQGFNFGIEMGPLLPFIKRHCPEGLDIAE